MPNNIYLWAPKVNFYLKKKKKKRLSRKRSTGKRVASTRESFIPYPHGFGQLYVFLILGFPRPSETVILQSQLTVLLSIIISKQVGIRILLRISHYCLTAPLPPFPPLSLSNLDSSTMLYTHPTVVPYTFTGQRIPRSLVLRKLNAKHIPNLYRGPQASNIFISTDPNN